MILVDTSAWIEYLRLPKSSMAEEVEGLIVTDEAVWCDQVALELIKGVTYPQRSKLLWLERVIPCLEIDEAVWNLARRLAWAARASGVTTPVGDVIVAACARVNGLSVFHKGDDHFHQLTTLPVQ